MNKQLSIIILSAGLITMIFSFFYDFAMLFGLGVGYATLGGLELGNNLFNKKVSVKINDERVVY